MFPQLAYRFLRSTDKRCLLKFVWGSGVKNAWATHLFKRRLKRGIWFPPFIHVSITSRCNLRCQGCWVDVDGPEDFVSLETMNRFLAGAKQHGNTFFGILGGEPFMYRGLLELLGAHSDCYFQVFTNGHFITEKIAEEMRRIANVSPLVSIEGLEEVSQVRRGKPEVFERTMRGLDNSVRAGLVTGVATSVCQSNIEELLSESWLRELIRRGVHYVWYYAYRPSGPNPNLELALRPDQHLRMRRFMVEMRRHLPILIVDAYYDQEGRALCPMAVGMSHHVSPRGWIEPCPVIQFAKENINDAANVYDLVTQSAFLKDFRDTARQATRGCIVLERPDLIRELVRRHGAHDSTARGTVLRELAATPPHFSQWLPGHEVRERHWLYWLMKRFGFNDFGAYRGIRHDVETRRREVDSRLDSRPAAGHTAVVNDGKPN